MNLRAIDPKVNRAIGVMNLLAAGVCIYAGDFGFALFNGAAGAYNIALWRAATS